MKATPPDSPLGHEPPPRAPTIPDVEVPTDKAGVEFWVNKALARGVELATNAKELAELVKVGTEWHKAVYGEAEGDGLGSALRRENGHHGG